MKKILFKFFVVFAFTTISAVSFIKSKNSTSINDLLLENVEAFARAETDDEFYQSTGCRASMFGNCGIHTYAYKP